MNETILIIEDDPKLRSGLKDNLEFEGYRVLDTWNADLGGDIWQHDQPSLVILDLMLPGRDGFSLLRDMRRRGLETPVIILSARGEEWDKVKGFRLGCDDYVVKPFSILELLSRIKAVLKRSVVSQSPEERLTVADVTLDLISQELSTPSGREILSGRELDLMAYFLRNLQRVIPRKELLEKVWQAPPDLDTRTVDVHVAALRRRLESSQCRIETVYKVGYRLVQNAE
jgi:DNA-binding response OmpR family regulator